MRPLLAWAALCGAVAGAAVQAQPAWRCGNEYTTLPESAQRPGCRAITAGRAAPARRNDNAGASRDQDTRSILEAELRTTMAQQARLRAEENQQVPAAKPPPAEDASTDRKAEIKAQIARNESDIAALRREIARVASPR